MRTFALCMLVVVLACLVAEVEQLRYDYETVHHLPHVEVFK